ncbi:hypothetical protein ABPG77_004967 [Micractinium sp. CCAP 211/92]
MVPLQRSGCKSCLTCCCRSIPVNKSYDIYRSVDDWQRRYSWPAGCPSPTVWFALRERQLEYQTRLARLQGPAAWRQPLDSRTCALLAARGAPTLRILVPLDVTGIASDDTAVYVRTVAPPHCSDAAPSAAGSAAAALQLHPLAQPDAAEAGDAEKRQASHYHHHQQQQQQLQRHPSQSPPQPPAPTPLSKQPTTLPPVPQAAVAKLRGLHPPHLVSGDNHLTAPAHQQGCGRQRPECQASLACRCAPVVINVGQAGAPARRSDVISSAPRTGAAPGWFEQLRELASSLLSSAPSGVARSVY